MARKSAVKVEPVATPDSKADAARWVANIGTEQRERSRLQAELNDKIAALMADYEPRAKVHADRINQLAAGLHLWANTNRETLCKGRTKTVGFMTGTMSWRTRPAKVSLRKVDDVIAEIQKLDLTQFLRTKVEIDKEAMLKEPKKATAIKGVSIGSAGEDFVIKPTETDLEEVAS